MTKRFCFQTAKNLGLLSCLLVPAAIGLSQHSDRSLPASAATFQPVLDTMFRTNSTKVQYNYVMTGRVRLVLFWVGADDVGGGYIRRAYGTADPETRITQVLFGSDPAKAPRKINHWGAGTEAITPEHSTFMGFMTSAKTNSAAEAQGDLKAKEEQGQYPFQAIVSVVDKDRALSRSIGLSSDRNFNLHEYNAARKLIAERLQTNGTTRELAGAKRRCRDARGFLQATDELIDRVLSSSKAAPQSVCYIHNARNYTLTLEEQSKVKRVSVRISRKDGTKLEKEYRDLIRAHFSILNHESEEHSTFELLLGTVGELRGVPVQIVHQPNWWFEAELNLESSSSGVQAN